MGRGQHILAHFTKQRKIQSAVCTSTRHTAYTYPAVPEQRQPTDTKT